MLSLQLDPASAQQNPQTAPLIRELVMFTVRAFPAACSLEDSIEHAQQDATFYAVELGMQQHAQERTALEQARLTHMVSRATAGLV
jgi:hypothetical protein